MTDMTENANSFIAFRGERRIAAGSLADVVRGAVETAAEPNALLVFDAVTSAPMELDLRGTLEEALARLAPSAAVTEDKKRGPGRPRLGVVPREVTLLPRHWDWLNDQPGGASAALRRLVDQARTAGDTAQDKRRRALEHAYRFMHAMLGDQADFEEATRALFAGDAARFTTLSSSWPADLREHARRLAESAFHGPSTS